MRQIFDCKILIFRKLYDETDYDCANVQKEDIVWKSRSFNRKAEQYFLFINGRFFRVFMVGGKLEETVLLNLWGLDIF